MRKRDHGCAMYTLHCQHNLEFNNASRRRGRRHCRRRSRRQLPHQRISYINLSGLVRRVVRPHPRPHTHPNTPPSMNDVITPATHHRFPSSHFI